MSMKFWKKERPNQATVQEVAQEKQPVERGYFDTVASADITVEPVGVPNIEMVTGSEQAMRLATVYRCTSILSGSIASLPLQLKRKRNGYFSVDEENPINYLLTVRPNNRQTAYDLIRNAVIQMVNAGNAYIYPDWRGGELHSITLLSPGSVSYDKMLNVYLVSDIVNDIYKTLECDDIIHLRNMSLDGGYAGVSVIQYASKVMTIADSANNKSVDVFQPGSTYSGFISGDDGGSVKGYGDVQDEQLKTVSDRVGNEMRSGKRVFSLPGAMKFNALSMSPADIQLMEELKFSVLELCRFYGVHPDKVFAGQSQNYKASEMSQVQFMTDTLQPLLRQITNEFFVKLIPRSLVSKYRIEFDLEAFYQTDLETMSTRMEKCIQWGVMTVNEYRNKIGYPSITGGDVTMISTNVAPINSQKIWGDNVKKENIIGDSDENGDKVPPT